ncbi:MAG: hypothetical protein K1X79_00540 [Oligoflexia bacterium]|nr:hypothetical protein [Oligoflexia bacterium]
MVSSRQLFSLFAPKSILFSALALAITMAETTSVLAEEVSEGEECGVEKSIGPQNEHVATGSFPNKVTNWPETESNLASSLCNLAEAKVKSAIICPVECPKKKIIKRDFGGFGTANASFYVTDGGSSECGRMDSKECCEHFNKLENRSVDCASGDHGNFAGAAGDIKVTLTYKCIQAGAEADPAF